MPCWSQLSLDGRVVDDDQLAWGMGGVGGEVDGGTVDSVPCGFGGVWGEATKVVEGKFSGGEQVRPTIGGKCYMSRREDRQEVILLAVRMARLALLARWF